MNAAYQAIFGNDSLKFCRFAYGNSSGIYDNSIKKDFQVSKITDLNNLGSGFSMEMFLCYQKSKSLKEFCNDVKDLGYEDMTSSQLLDCYTQFSKFNSNIKQDDIDKLQSDIKCESEGTVELKYKCLGRDTSTSDFCYEKFVAAEIT